MLLPLSLVASKISERTRDRFVRAETKRSGRLRAERSRHHACARSPAPAFCRCGRPLLRVLAEQLCPASAGASPDASAAWLQAGGVARPSSVPARAQFRWADRSRIARAPDQFDFGFLRSVFPVDEFAAADCDKRSCAELCRALAPS